MNTIIYTSHEELFLRSQDCYMYSHRYSTSTMNNTIVCVCLYSSFWPFSWAQERETGGRELINLGRREGVDALTQRESQPSRATTNWNNANEQVAPLCMPIRFAIPAHQHHHPNF
jgi:hypothetical protein